MKTKLLLLSTLFSIFSIAQKVHLFEDFNLGILPTGWNNSTFTGSTPWQFGINGTSIHAGNTNLNGTSFAYFDDDALGGSSINNTVELLSPSFNNSTDSLTFLEFDYNFRQFNAPTDYFDVSVFDGTTWISVLNVTTSDCGNYISPSCIGNFPHANIDISQYKNSNCQVRFTYHDGNDWCWYVGLDNVKITSPYEYDLSIKKIISPVSGCQIDSSSISVLVKNEGRQTSNSTFILRANINGGSQIISETVSLPLNFGDSAIYNFTQKGLFSTNNINLLEVSLSYPNDGDNFNDTILGNFSFYNPISLPYTNNFETIDSTWYSEGFNNSWEQGIPNANIIDTATSGTKIYATNLSGNYNNNETSFLYTPCFDLSADTSAVVISFDINFASETINDFLIVEYLLNNDTVWKNISLYNDSVTWYNSFNGFQGVSGSWQKKSKILDFLKNQSIVRFRFSFISNSTIKNEGFGIDRFNLYFQKTFDIQLVKVYNNISQNPCATDSTNFYYGIKNLGITPIDTSIVSFKLNLNPIYEDTIIKKIKTGEFEILTSHLNSKLLIGNNSLNTWVLTNNPSSSKDSILNFKFNYNPPTQNAYTFPYSENFDSFTTGTNSTNTNDNLSNDWIRHSNNAYSWRVENTNTFTSGTGPNSDFTGGNYIYTEASGGLLKEGDISFIESPCIIMPDDTTAIVSFYNYNFGHDINKCTFQIFNGFTWKDEIVIRGETQQNSNDTWKINIKKINIIPNQQIKVRFKAERGRRFYGDLAIDDLRIYGKSTNDIILREIISPISACNLDSSEIVQVEIYNNSFQDILPNSISVNYQLNGGNFITENILDTLKFNSSILHNFSQSLNLNIPNSVNNLKVNSINNSDSVSFNNSLNRNFYNYSSTINFNENFEGANINTCQDRVSEDIQLPNNWKSSTPIWLVQNDSLCNFSAIQGATMTDSTGPSSAYSGNKFIYLESSKLPGRDSIINLESPCFDLTNQSAVILEFYYHMYGSEPNNLYIEIIDSLNNHLIVDSIIGQTHFSPSDSWSLKSINLNGFTNQLIKVNFKLINRGKDIIFNNPAFKYYQGDLALDDILVYNPITTSLEKPQESNSNFTLYPNPNNGIFNLKVEKGMIGKIYQVFDMKGALIKEAKIDANLSQINLEQIDKGVYFLRVDGIGETKKLVVY